MTTPEHLSTNILPPGTIVGNTYRIKRVLNQSSAAVVYAASHIMMEKDVALKVLTLFKSSADETRLLRFQQEAKSASSLEHPNIVKTFSSGCLDNGSPYIVMELVDGETLREHLNGQGCLRLEVFKDVFSQLLSGLECAHNARILHRDIKPENILLAKGQDGALLARLSDFGIAKVIDESSAGQSLTSTSEMLGSPAYMSPEQCEKKPLDERSDIYSLACVMYETLGGRAPFVSDSPFDLMYKQINEQAISLPKLKRIPPTFWQLIEKGLQKNPEKRWATARELRTALEALQIGGGLSTGQMLSRAIVIAMLAGLLAAFATMCYSRWQKEASKRTIVNTAPHPRPIGNTSQKELPEPVPVSFEEVCKAINTSRIADASKMLDQMKHNPNLDDKSHLENCYALLYVTIHDYASAKVHASEASRLALADDPLIKTGKYNDRYDDPRLKELSCLAKMKEFPAAQKILAEEEKRRKQPDAEQTLDIFYLRKCEFLRSKKDYDGDIELCRSKLNHANLSRALRIRFLAELMKTYALQNNWAGLNLATSQVRSAISDPNPDPEAGPKDKSVFTSLAAEAYLLTDRGEKARPILDAARGFDRDYIHDDTLLTAHLLQLEAACDLARGALPAAEGELKRALAIQEKLGDKETVPVYLHLAYIAYKNGNATSGQSFMNKALAKGKEEWSWCSPEIQFAEAELFLASQLKEEGKSEAARRILEQAELLPQLSKTQHERVLVLSRSLK